LFCFIHSCRKGLSCGLLSFNHYALLSSIRYAINERFHLTTPQTSGLFYLAPGFGYICGSILGGMLSDRVVRMYIKKRNGVRLPRDRLNCGVFAMLIFLPLGTLLFGWSLDRKIGGMALPAVGAFTAAASLMTSFGGVNTFAVGMSRPSVLEDV
jgi:MFS family permease